MEMPAAHVTKRWLQNLQKFANLDYLPVTCKRATMHTSGILSGGADTIFSFFSFFFPFFFLFFLFLFLFFLFLWWVRFETGFFRPSFFFFLFLFPSSFAHSFVRFGPRFF